MELRVIDPVRVVEAGDRQYNERKSDAVHILVDLSDLVEPRAQPIRSRCLRRVRDSRPRFEQILSFPDQVVRPVEEQSSEIEMGLQPVIERDGGGSVHARSENSAFDASYSRD